MDQQTNPVNDEITLSDILLFIKRYFVKILVRGILSVVVILAVAVLVWLIMPYTRHYYFEVENMLKKDTQSKMYVYPNNRAFNSQDIISPIVTRVTYDKMKLQDKVPYDKFSTLFYINNSSIKLALLDAEYDAKLSKKNLNAVNISLLEKEYNQKKESLANNIFSINMKSHSALSNAECIQALTMLPEIWYTIYSRTEAATDIPKVELATWSKDFEQSLASGEGSMILLEKARIYCEQLYKTCKSLRNMQDGKNVALPTGEFLEDVERQLQHIYKFQISIYSRYVAMSPKLFTQYDNIFMQHNLKNILRKSKEIEENIDHTVQALNILQANNKGKMPVATSGNTNNNSTTSFEFSASVLSQITDLVRNDVTNKLRQDIAEKLLRLGTDKADLLAEHDYINDLVNLQKNKTQSTDIYTAAQFNNKLKLMQKDIIDTAKKIQQFRSKITEEYFSSRLFYKPASNHVKVRKSYAIPPFKLLCGLLALCAIYNVIMICLDFKFKYQR